MRTLFSSLLAFAALSAASSAAANTRVYTTARAPIAPRIDGRIDEPIWDSVEWAGDFIQRDPAEGEPPSVQTAFKILYDDQNVYVAYRAFDPQPDQIANILARRDHFPGDWVEINIDSYHDHRTAFSFTASVSGTQGDEFISEDGNSWNSNWDPVWEHKARIDGEGWTAEVRIPLSQLRYGNKEEHVWGIQVMRRLYRNEERSTWQMIPKGENGWVSKFGELRGIRGIKAQRRIELLPYTLAQAERFEKIEGDPFADGSRGKISGGLDGKVGVTSDLTLDFTINPDFGQVEADPSQVNLTAFETFFQERRPFFIEGNNILQFRLAPSVAFGTHTRDKLFYSRRIGRQPHYRADWHEDGSVDQPDHTSILGAFKLTGKTKKGMSIGILESATAKEKAEIDLEGQRRKVTVEPFSNYFVGRLQQDFRRGDTRLGGMFTAVNRKIEDSEVEFLHDAAYAGGLDFFHYLAERRYYLALNLLRSNVRGSEEAILGTQTAPARYYQRPDNDGQSVDSTRTSLSGHSGCLRIGKSKGNLNFETGIAWRSPGFEINDVGFMRNADEINQFSWVGYSFRNPFSIFRRMGLNFNQWFDFEYGGENLYRAVNFNTNASFVNNWNYNFSISREGDRISNYELRGGPSIRMAGNVNWEVGINSDYRRRLSFGLGTWASRHDEDSGVSNGVWTYVTWRPSNAIRIELNPSYSHNQPEMQYTTACSVEDDTRYIYAHLDQKTFDLSFRIDYSLTPNLTLQYYGSPFVSAGRYGNFKRITAPRARAYRDRFVFLGEELRYDTGDSYYYVDEDDDGADDYSFSDPDFNVRAFNSNLVIRWQYSPGSSLYLVWSQSRFGYATHGDFELREDLDGLFDVHPHNVFLLKVSRWFNL
jgi:hypothetical protein